MADVLCPLTVAVALFAWINFGGDAVEWFAEKTGAATPESDDPVTPSTHGRRAKAKRTTKEGR